MVALPISVFTSPIFAKNLSAYDYSAIGFFTAVMSFFIPIINLSFYNYYMLDYFKREEKEKKDILQSLFSFLLVFNVFVVGLGYLGISYYLKITNSQFNVFPLAIIVLLSGVFSLGEGFWLLRLRFERKSSQYFIISLIRVVFNISIGLLLVVKFQEGVTGKLLPKLIISLVLFLIFFAKFIKKIKIDFKIIRKAIVFSWPVMFSALLNLPVLTFDKIVLERVHNIEEFAFYNIAANFAAYLFTFFNAILMAFEPDIYKLVGEKDKKKLVQIFFVLVFIIILSDTVFIMLSKPIIEFLTAGRYMGAVKYANLLVVAQSEIIFIYFIGTVLTALRLTRVELIIMIITAVTSIILLLSMVSSFQFYGAIYANILTYSIWFIMLTLTIIFRKNKNIKRFYVKP
jgi:O-antigen/teichoic acid export membrane protein